MSNVTLTSLAAALTLGCAHYPPQYTSGPAVAANGVSVALVSQTCDQNKDPDFWGDDLVFLSVDLSFSNPTPRPITVYRSRIRVLAPDGIRASTMTWNASKPIRLAPSETRVVPLVFSNRGSLDCNVPLAIDLDGSIDTGNQTENLPPIHFVAGL